MTRFKSNVGSTPDFKIIQFAKIFVNLLCEPHSRIITNSDFLFFGKFAFQLFLKSYGYKKYQKFRYWFDTKTRDYGLSNRK